MIARKTQRAKSSGRRSSIALVLSCCLGVVLISCRLLTFAAPTGMTSRPRARSGLRPTEELPAEEPEPEPLEREPEPERRLPYTMHISSHMPNNEHLGEGKATEKQIQKKIANSLENAEELIQHVEVRFQVSDNFHKDKQGRNKVRAKAVGDAPSKFGDEDDVDGPVVTAAELKEEVVNNPGGRVIAPYHFEVTVEMKNKRQVVLSKSKHAQPTLSEALDHTADSLRNLIRAEKERQIKEWRKPKTSGEGEDLLDNIEEEINAEADPDAQHLEELERDYRQMIQEENFIDQTYKNTA